MSYKKRRIIVCLVAFSLISLSGLAVYGGIASASATKIHPKDKPLEVKVEKKITLGTTIETEIVSMKLVSIAPITVNNFQGSGDYQPYPVFFDIFTEIEYNGITSHSIEQQESIFGLKVEVLEDEENVRFSHGFLGNLNFVCFDEATLTMTMFEAHIDGSFIYESDAVTGDYKVRSELFFDLSIEIMDQSGPPVLLSRHSTSSSLGMSVIPEGSGEPVMEMTSEFVNSFEASLVGTGEEDISAGSFLEQSLNMVPGTSGPKFVLRDNSGIRIDTTRHVEHDMSSPKAEITGLESSFESHRETQIRSGIVNVVLEGTHTGTWNDDDIEVTPTDILGELTFSCVFFDNNWLPPNPPKPKPVKIKPKPKPVVIPDIPIFLNDDIFNQILAPLTLQGELKSECHPKAKGE